MSMEAAVQDAYTGMSVDELFREYRRAPSNELKWEIVLRHKKFITETVMRLRNICTSFSQVEDVIDEVIIELVNAVDTYDPEKASFKAYVYKRICGIVIDLAHKESLGPRYFHRKVRAIERANSELYCELGRLPTDEEVAAHSGMSIEQYRKTMANASLYSTASLDEMLENYAELPSASVKDAASELDPENIWQRTELMEILASKISMLSKSYQLVLSLYYEKELGMREIAEILGVTTSRVSQIHASAIQKLRVLMSDYSGVKQS